MNIKISSYRIDEKSMRKFVLYGVNGEDSFGLFDVERRYSDFECLRKALVVHWPGCIIP